jgi:hypothetical protein
MYNLLRDEYPRGAFQRRTYMAEEPPQVRGLAILALRKLHRQPCFVFMPLRYR